LALAKSSKGKKRSTSTELTGGAGFDYEHRVAALYLTALIRSERAPGTLGRVTRVAVQQEAAGEPMDDVVVDVDIGGETARTGLQVKTSLVISSAQSNEDFRAIINKAEQTRQKAGFRAGKDAYGFAAYEVSDSKIRSLKRVVDWAKASPTPSDYVLRFKEAGQASLNDNKVRKSIQGLLGESGIDYEWDFLRHFVALKLDVNDDQSPYAVSAINSLSEVLTRGGAESPVLWTDLCNHAKVGGKVAEVWTRGSILASLRSRFNLVCAPVWVPDIKNIASHVEVSLRQINDEIGGHIIKRSDALSKVLELEEDSRFINITGLPGCGKSVVLKAKATEAATSGPILFLKSDRLEGTTWVSHANSLGLQNTDLNELLIEIGSSGTPTLFVDGVDRIKVEQRQVVLDVLDAVFFDDCHSDWNVIVTSRDQGLEAFRSWLGPALINKGGFRDVSIGPLSDVESSELAEKIPNLRGLLFGDEKVKEIARRPFFASILAGQATDEQLNPSRYPSTEAELIDLWWQGGGFNAEKGERFKRQRALIDLAKRGATSLGKKIPTSDLQDGTVEHFSLLEEDHVVQSDRTSNWLSFSHDVFFEWAFYKFLLGLETDWLDGILQTGEAPLLGRIVELLSQFHIEQGLPWSTALETIEQAGARRQWERAWLLGPSSSPKFYDYLGAFEPTIFSDEGKRLSDFLIWFQAEKTVPNPFMLANDVQMDAEQRVRIADALGWPSDSKTWSRVIYWLISRWNQVPVGLRFHCLEIFSVWQNLHREFENPVSKKIIARVSDELTALSSEDDDKGVSEWASSDRERLASYLEKLRELLLVSAGSYPEAAKLVISLANPDDWDSSKKVEQVLMFTPLLSTNCAEEIADLTFESCKDELPKARYEAAMKARGFWSNSSFDQDDIGIKQHGTPFFPPTPLKEPFFSLLGNARRTGLDLIRNLSNRAIKGWRQSHDLPDGQRQTPLPLRLHFPWGVQEFWGCRDVYLWSRGSLGPQPIESAYLALSYWAHKRIDAGDNPDDLIKLILEKNKSVAAVGVAASIILQTQHISDVSLPIIANFKIWDMDINRQAQEMGRGMMLMGIDPLHGSSDKERSEMKYLDERAHKSLTLQSMAPAAIFSTNEELREKFKTNIAAFEKHLPIYFREELKDSNHVEALKRIAGEWARMADSASYQIVSEPNAEGKSAIAYVPPQPTTKEGKEQQKEAQSKLGEYNVFFWAKARLSGETPDPNYDLEDVIAFAKKRARRDSLRTLERAGEGVHQAALAAVATLIQRESDSPEHVKWAWKILDRIDGILPNADEPSDGKNMMDPRHYLIASLGGRLLKIKDNNAAERLLCLASAETEDISEMAFLALFNAAKAFPKAAWAGGLFASKLASLPGTGRAHFDKTAVTTRMKASREALKTAIQELRSADFSAFPNVPTAWIYDVDEDELFSSEKKLKRWLRPKDQFDWGVGKRVFKHFPVEVWMQDEKLSPLATQYFRQMTCWMKESLDPDWMEKHDKRHRSSNFREFPRVLGHLLSRLSPYLPSEKWYAEFVEPFQINDHDSGEAIIEAIISGHCSRHLLDSPELSSGSIEIHRQFIAWLCSRREFVDSGWRDGTLYGHYIPYMIKNVLLVSVPEAHGSCRFANGDWKDFYFLSPAISELMGAAGWVPFVMEQYLTMCERAGVHQPLNAFCEDVRHAMEVVSARPELWSGSLISARISARVQSYAKDLHPLSQIDKTNLLEVLDCLIDLGDRRAVALEQSEAFRNLQRVR
jgi:hypothetical protein